MLATIADDCSVVIPTLAELATIADDCSVVIPTLAVFNAIASVFTSTSDCTPAIAVPAAVPTVASWILPTAETKSEICFTFNCAMYIYIIFRPRDIIVSLSIYKKRRMYIDTPDVFLNLF